MKISEKIKYIAFDADDTLWPNELYYHRTKEAYLKLMSFTLSGEEVEREILKTELANMKLFGFGTKGFTLSLIETALRIGGTGVSNDKIEGIIKLGKELLNSPVDLFDGVDEVLQKLGKKYKLIVATKGDLHDQERKLAASGVEPYFHHIEIMSNKKEQNYRKLLDHLEISPEEFLMVGNSVKSDILPVLNLGGFAVHIPYHLTWEYERHNDEDIKNPRFFELEKIRELLKLV